MQDIPVLQVRGKSIAEGYERAIYSVYKSGCEIAIKEKIERETAKMKAE